MKINWLVKGDRPTNFFYNKINARIPCRRSNYTLNSVGSWISSSRILANGAVKYFSNLFSASQADVQFSNITCKEILSERARENLCEPQIEEIKTAIFQINDNSTPGPDGINSKIFKVH